MTGAAARVTHVLETSLYVTDLDRSEAFYARLFGFPSYFRDARMRALGVPGGAVLLLFRRGASTVPSPAPGGGTIPAHDATGAQHLCFAIPENSLPAWEDRLAAEGIAIESRVTWPRGAVSLYFRDPDGHSLEVATPRLWPNDQADAGA